MVKSSFCDKGRLRKGAWSQEEDRKLIAYVTRYGHWNWNLLPKFAGLERCGKSCRLRWLNYLRPNIKRGNYTQEEDETIIKLLQRLGNRWSAIAAELPGRTDNEIKNYWHSNLKKRYQQNSETSGKGQVSQSKDESPVEEIPTTANGPFQSLPSNSESTDWCTMPCLSEFSITPQDHSAADSNRNFVPEDEFDFLNAYQEPLNRSLWLEPYVVDISSIPCEILVAERDCFSPVRDVPLWSHSNEYCA